MRKSSGKGGEGLPPPGDNSDDPVVAFDALRKAVERYGADTAAEMNVIRRSVETALDRYERMTQPVDYSPDLGSLVQQAASLDERLGRIEDLTVLKQTPQFYAQAVVYASEQTRARLIGHVVETLDDYKRDNDVLRSELRTTLQGVRDRRDQNVKLAIAGGAGVVVGIVLLLILPRLLPFDATGHVAAAVIGKDRWDAGQQMMQKADPASWVKLTAKQDIMTANAAELDKCQQAAARTGREQKCQVLVSVPTK